MDLKIEKATLDGYTTTTIPKLESEINRVDNKINESLKPLSVLVEEQSTTIIALTNELKCRGEDNSKLIESINELTESNLKAECNIQDLKIQLENETKKCELYKNRLNTSFVTNTILVGGLILNLILQFI